MADVLRVPCPDVDSPKAFIRLPRVGLDDKLAMGCQLTQIASPIAPLRRSSTCGRRVRVVRRHHLREALLG